MRRAAALLLLLVLSGCMIGRPEPVPRQPRRPAAKPVQTKPVTPPPRVAAPPARTDWVARRVVPTAIVTPEGRFHAVKAGETGIAIARAYGLAWRDLIALNKLQEPFVLRVGQRLRLAPAEGQDLLDQVARA